MLVLFFICSANLSLCTTMAEQQVNEPNELASSIRDTIDFKTRIQPILQKNCTPCHFPGGKMYDKMPFDKGETIIAFKDKLIKRIKDEQELALIKQFIIQNK